MPSSSLVALIVAGALTILMAPVAGAAELNSQQQRMKDCNGQASGMSGTARQNFMSSCLSNKPAEAKKPNCNPAKSKPCGNSCISLDKTCHK
jgi:hypothetical protein